MKIIIEKHIDGYCGYPLGFANGAILGQGDSYLEVLESTQSSIRAFIDYYGKDEFNSRFIADNHKN